MLALLYGRYYVPNKKGCVIKSSITKKETDAELPLGIFATPEYADISAIIYSCSNTLGKLTALALSKGLPTFNGVIDVVRDIEDESFPFKFRCVCPETPEIISDGIFVFHNPNARKPIKPTIFKKTNVTHYFLDDDQIKIRGVTTPLFSRFSTNKVIIPHLLQNILENEFVIGSDRSWNQITYETIIDILQE